MTSTFESLVLDGLSLNDGTTFDLQGFEFGPAQKRQRWISGEDADGDVLAEPSRQGNRAATITLGIVRQADMDTALAKIGQIVDKLYEAEQQPDGLALVWTPADATKQATAYVLSGEITGLPVTIDSGWFQKSPSLTIRLDCLPGMDGTTVTSAATVTNTDPVQILTITGVTGDMPAKGRIVVTDGASKDRRHLEWGAEWRYYDAATSLLIDSDSLVTTGFSGSGSTRTGAYDPGAAGNSVIRLTGLTTQPVAVCGTGNLGHVGNFRIKARIWSNAAQLTPYVRFVWQEGDGPLRANPPVLVNGIGAWTEVDLGTISIPPKLLGTQRWTGRVEAWAETSNGTAVTDVDYLELFPTAQYGKARAVQSFDSLTSVLARDEFEQTAGALAGKIAAVGGAWAAAGDADDFSVNATDDTAERTAVSDTAAHIETIGSAITDSLVQADIKWSTLATTIKGGVVARYTDVSNYLRAEIAATNGSPAVTVNVYKRVAGTDTLLYSSAGLPVVSFNPTFITAGSYFSTRLVVDSSGQWFLWVWPQGATPTAPIMYGSDSALATGGTLASGKVGFFDYQASATAITRSVKNFMASADAAKPVVYSGRTAEIRHDKHQRQDSTGTYYGDLRHRGAHFYLEPSGDENRPTRLIVKLRRTDVDLGTDENISDSATVTVHYTPRWSTVPR